MSQMASSLLLQTLRNASANHLIRRCRYLWTILWRIIQRCVSFLVKRRRSATPSPQNNDQRGSRAEVVPTGTTQILPSLLPTDRPQSRQSGWRLTSRPSLISSSSGISLHVIPPDDDAASVTSSQFERRSSRGDSMTLHSGNTMSSQTLMVRSLGANRSRASLVIPASTSLLPAGDVVEHETRINTEGISKYIYPLMPHEVPRYKRERFIEDTAVEYEVVANQDTFSMGELPIGWEQVTHPEGQPYFYHADKRIVTECWLWDQEMFNILNNFIDQFEDFTRSRNLTQPDDVDLLLEVSVVDGKKWCGYYYVSASTRRVFWLEHFDISTHVSEVRGNILPTHIKLYLEYQYWFHWDLFPNIGGATDDIYDLVLNTIADARTDVQSSRTSTVNQSKDDLIEMAEIVEGMQKRRSSASHWCLGRFMQVLVKDQFINYHGQYGARLDHLQSIHSNEVLRKTWLMQIISPLLLSAPNVHLKSLNELWVDKITLKARWVNFFIKMSNQWGDIVHASILLNANVGFLAIPSNDPSNNSSLQSARTGAQIASYLSIVSSFASMLLALILVRQHKAKERDLLDVNEYHTYVHTHGASKYGFERFERLAIVYSLPYALLTWGLATFLVAFLLMCFVKSTTTARSIVAFATVLILALIAWCVCMFWEETDFHLRRCFKTVWNRLTEKRGGEEHLSLPNQDDHQGETESRHGNDEAHENGTESKHDVDSTEVSQKGTSSLRSWMTCVKSWRGVASLKGNARPSDENITLSV